jgi:hypothetical protein
VNVKKNQFSLGFYFGAVHKGRLFGGVEKFEVCMGEEKSKEDKQYK